MELGDHRALGQVQRLGDVRHGHALEVEQHHRQPVLFRQGVHRLPHVHLQVPVLRRTAPAYIEDISEIHRTEPYVYSQMIAGKDAPSFGEAKNSWLTGTAAWTFLSVSQAILGVKPALDGLEIDPCIPAGWKGFTLERRFRGAEYRIRVENPDGVEKGVRRITADGREIAGRVLPPAPAGSTVDVLVVMG